MDKSSRLCAPKATPRTLFIFINNPKQSLNARHSFTNNILKKKYEKAFKKLTLFFIPNIVAFNGQD